MSALLPIETLVPPGLRAELRGQFANLPHPQASAMADLLADLTVLAVGDSLAAVDRVAARAPNHGAQMCVLSASVSTLAATFKTVSEALVSYAEASGAQVYSAQVRMGGGK